MSAVAVPVLVLLLWVLVLLFRISRRRGGITPAGWTTATAIASAAAAVNVWAVTDSPDWWIGWIGTALSLATAAVCVYGRRVSIETRRIREQTRRANGRGAA